MDMKSYFHAFAMCQSMFCAIPFPGHIWDENARDKMLLFLPLVGLEIGGLWAVLSWLCAFLKLPAFVTGLILCAFPYLITGFIHLDGFMDVADAVRSWRDLDRRREILKDSHVGSFAVIGIVLLVLSQFVFITSASRNASHLILILIPAVSRACSAMAVAGLKPMASSQYAGQTRHVRNMVIPGILLCLFLVLGFLLCGKYGVVLIGCVIGYGLALLRGYQSLDGMNGDISGYALTLGELCAVAVYGLI